MSNGKGNGKRCTSCGFRIRGSEHEKGQHHNSNGKMRRRAGEGKK